MLESQLVARTNELERRDHSERRLREELRACKLQQVVVLQQGRAWEEERSSMLLRERAYVTELAELRGRIGALQRQLSDQHAMLIEQQKALRKERAAARAADVGLQQLREELPSLEQQLERAQADSTRRSFEPPGSPATAHVSPPACPPASPPVRPPEAPTASDEPVLAAKLGLAVGRFIAGAAHPVAGERSASTPSAEL